MNDAPLFILFLILALLLILSAFFSSSETSLMMINRYRLKHLKNHNYPPAVRIDKLLQKTDELLSTILFGNNFVNILASAIATIIGIRLFGNNGLVITTGLLTFAVLVFAEITPKTIASKHPETVAFFASIPLTIITYLLKPFVWWINLFTKIILKIFRIKSPNNGNELNKDEIRTALVDSKNSIRASHYKMLLGIIDLEKLTAEDIMIPRQELSGVDIDLSSEQIIKEIISSDHTRIPVYKGDMRNCIGMLHTKNILKLMQGDAPSKEQISQFIREPFFIPETALLDEQLKILQAEKRRTALVVNEYGELQGLITLEDILEEIIGNFTTNPNEIIAEINRQKDGSYLVDCGILIRELNQKLSLKLPIKPNAKTLNGLILHTLEDIPKSGTSLKIGTVTMDVVATKDTGVKTVKLSIN